ncbi:MAG: OmpH family outer membrane protein [Pirellulaceae bacterium]|nr:OmpH family outer membrane protein [Pirellulaceae bacterium]
MTRIAKGIVILLFVTMGLTTAQYAKAQAPPVVVIDVSHIFKNHSRFKAAQEVLKAEVEAFDQQVKADQEKGQKLAEQLKSLNVGSPDYKAVEGQLAQLSANIQAQVALKQRDMMDREAKLYHSTYQEIETEVRTICEQNNIFLALRFSRDQMDVANRESVLNGINRAVIYQNAQKNVDITDMVLTKINSRVASGTRGAIRN